MRPDRLYVHPRSRWRPILLLIGLLASGCALVILVVVAVALVRAAPHPAGRLLTAQAVSPTRGANINRRLPGPSSVRKDDTATPPPTAAPSPTAKPTAPLTSTLQPAPLTGSTHFILSRPVGPNATGLVPDWTYLYGDTQHGKLEVHHGEEFVNPIGTPVLAVAEGTVVTAGDDKFPLCGPDGAELCGPYRDFYGNLVVLKLDQTFDAQSIFALCGHMDTVGVQVGQHVQTGDPLGTIGMTGIAVGPHCHFEVRLGVNDYDHTRNPILWMKPLSGRGAIAGRVLDRAGNLLPGLNVYLYLDNATEDWVMDTETYGHDQYPPVNPDDRWHENWALGDLPAGRYLVRVQIGQTNYYQHIPVEDGQLTFATFREQ